MKKKYKFEKGWVAFIKDNKLVDIVEFPKGGLADTILEPVSKPTKQEVLDELAARNIPSTK